MGGRRLGALGLVLAGALALPACGNEQQGTAVSGQGLSSTPVPSSTAPSTSRRPFAGKTLKVGEVAKVPNLSGAQPKRVEDGRLSSYYTSLKVLEIGTAEEVTPTEHGDAFRAEDGATLLAFSIQVDVLDSKARGKVTASVSVDGRQRSLPDFDNTVLVSDRGSQKTHYYIVGLADDRRSADLELKYADLGQQFDLLEGRRKGEQPKVLYRSSSAPSVWVENLVPAAFDIVNSEKPDRRARYVMAVERAELTYFAPDGATGLAGNDKAWLVVESKYTLDGEWAGGLVTCNVPTPAFSLKDAAGTVVTAVERHSKVTSGSKETTVTFEVPADLEQATLTVAPQAVDCSGTQWKAQNAATVEIKLPKN